MLDFASFLRAGIEQATFGLSHVRSNRSATHFSPMNNESGYIIYSAAGSFFIPMFLIFYLNIMILKHARLAGKIQLNQFTNSSKNRTTGITGSKRVVQLANSDSKEEGWGEPLPFAR